MLNGMRRPRQVGVEIRSTREAGRQDVQERPLRDGAKVRGARTNARPSEAIWRSI
jgi:hypothetical protein